MKMEYFTIKIKWEKLSNSLLGIENNRVSALSFDNQGTYGLVHLVIVL